MAEMPDISTAVDNILARTGSDADRLIPILQAVQDQFHYLPEAALRDVTGKTGIPMATITGVATFYSQFRLQPAGQHTIRVCIGTACHVKGANSVFEAFKRQLGIGDETDTDADRLFTVEKVACLGCCMLAPAVQVDELTYGHVDPRKVDDVLRDFLRDHAAGGGGRKSAASSAAARGECRICLCSSCVAGGSRDVYAECERLIAEWRLPLRLKAVSCTGESFLTPSLELCFDSGDPFRYARVPVERVGAILRRHMQPRGAVTRLRAAYGRLLDSLVSEQSPDPPSRYLVRPGESLCVPGKNAGCRLATEGAGELEPLDMEGYRQRGGWQALETCLREVDPGGIIDVILQSGLRGRGGAGYPSGNKWRQVREAPGEEKVVICNGDEGDPGAFMDRMLLESFPYRVLEGMAIAARAVGATRGFVYVRAEYPLAVSRVREAAVVCRQAGWLGTNILDCGFDFDIDIVPGAGAFVCGEETAMIAALEGQRGMPRYRPPYPAVSGWHGQPTLVNNVETFSLVPWIVRNGPEAFTKLGTASSHGTKTFALAGKIRDGGLIEVPMGMPLRRIVDDIGGGVEGDRTLKAVQIGGPSGGCVPAALADTPVDYEALGRVGAIMGSGGLVVLDDSDCMVDVARYFMDFTQHESCGKCTFCRVGTKRMLEILEALCEGHGKPEHLEALESLAESIRVGSLCGLGRTAPNPVISTLQHFREEYEAHIDGHCPAGVCKALIHYEVTDECIGCTRCAQRCPVDAIEPRPYRKHEIDRGTCIRCDTCRRVCPADSIRVVSGA